MSFYCKNGSVHQHQTREESRRCWGLISPTAPVPASAPIEPKDQPGSISPRQKSYINDLGGHWEVDWSYNTASKEITRLLDQNGDRRATKTDPRLEVVKNMLDMIPDGYYATAPDGAGGHIDFVRIKRPTSGRLKGCLKVQTQHSERWQEALVYYPNSGKWSVFNQKVVDMLLLVIADHHGCSKRYAIEVQACMCCNKTLTDDRSRHYLIGPVCDKKAAWQWVFEEVDAKNGGLSFEQMVARGLPTRIWQEKEFAA